MHTYKVLLLLIVLCFPCFGFAWQATPVIDYSRADSLALTVKYNGDINVLTKQLTGPFSNPTLKARAIFRWLTENVAYDYKYFNKYAADGPVAVTFNCPDDDTLDCHIKKQVWEIAYITRILDKGKGVCQGYAMLFKTMCGIAGIQSEVIPGYTRTEYYEIGTMGQLDHAWNVVLLNGTYYPVDATWAAGTCATGDDGKLISFHKQFNDYYWLTPPDEFAKSHFPETGTKGLPAKFTKEKFMTTPYYAPGEASRIKLIAPATGIITAKRGDTIRFKLHYSGDLRQLQINTSAFQNPDIWYYQYINKHKTIKTVDSLALKKQQYIKYKQQGDLYEFAYVVKDYTLDWIDLMFDKERVMRFKVKMGR